MQSEFLYNHFLLPSLNNGYILIDIHVYACVYTHKHTHTHTHTRMSHFFPLNCQWTFRMFAAVEYYSAFKCENSAICDNMNEPEVKQTRLTR